jgi:phosphoserine aminotransferase
MFDPIDRSSMRVHNFGAGPCTLPLDVLEEVREEFLDFAGSGMSLIELSHRSPVYEEVHGRALTLAREVAAAPDDFEVLFIQGGATLQFSMVPLNLLVPGRARRRSTTLDGMGAPTPRTTELLTDTFLCRSRPTSCSSTTRGTST